MRKLLLMMGLLLIGTLVVVFSIPAARNIILNPFLRNAALSAADIRLHDETQTDATGEVSSFREVKFPEPDIERIKNELVGKKIPGWNFDRITEFKKAVISSIARTGQRIDFRVDLHMLPYDARGEEYYDAQVFVIYLAGDEDWVFDRVEMVYLSYDIQVPPGRWSGISAIEGCSMQPESKYRLAWTSKTWDYEILSGPGIDEVSLPPAPAYEVRSKAKKPVKVKLTFRPGPSEP